MRIIIFTILRFAIQCGKISWRLPVPGGLFLWFFLKWFLVEYKMKTITLFTWFFVALCLISPTLGLSQPCVEEYLPSIVEVDRLDIVPLGGMVREDAQILYSLGSEGLNIIDYSEPGNLTILSSTPFNNDFDGYSRIECAISGHWFLVDTEAMGIVPIDVSDPTSPVVYPAFFSDSENLGLASHNGDFFVSVGEKGIVWFGAEALPALDPILIVSLNELTDGAIDLPAEGSFASNGESLFFIQNGGHLFKLKPSLLGGQPGMECQFREYDGSLEFEGNFSSDIYIHENLVWYSFTGYSPYPWPLSKTRVVDQNEIQTHLAQYPGRLGRSEFLQNGQAVMEGMVYDIDGPVRSWVRYISGYSPPFHEASGNLLFCRISGFSYPDFVLLQYSDFHEPTRIVAHYALFGQDPYYSGVTIRPPFANVFGSTIDYPGSPSQCVGSVYYINEDGSFSQIASICPFWQTSRFICGGSGDGGAHIFDIERGEIVWSGISNGQFVSRDLYTDNFSCKIESSDLILNDLTVAPPVAMGHWSAGEDIASPNILFRDRFFFCGIAPSSMGGIVVLDLQDPTNPQEIARITGVWPESSYRCLPTISGEVLSVDHLGQTTYFDISDPTNPQQLPEYPYPGIVKEDICLTFEGNHATVYLVPSLHNHYPIGQIYTEYSGSEGDAPQWAVSGTSLIIEMDRGFASYFMPCASQVPTQLQYFALSENGSQIIWKFDESVDAADLRLLGECGPTSFDLPLQKMPDGTWAADIPQDLDCPPGRTLVFNLLFNQEGATWTIIGTLEKSIVSHSSEPVITSISPNPCNPNTTISFSLPEAQIVKVGVFDLAGRRVRSLVQGNLPRGDHQVTWDGRNPQGGLCASGSYFFQLETDSRILNRKITLLK